MKDMQATFKIFPAYFGMALIFTDFLLVMW